MEHCVKLPRIHREGTGIWECLRELQLQGQLTYSLYWPLKDLKMVSSLWKGVSTNYMSNQYIVQQLRKIVKELDFVFVSNVQLIFLYTTHLGRLSHKQKIRLLLDPK